MHQLQAGFIAAMNENIAQVETGPTTHGCTGVPAWTLVTCCATAATAAGVPVFQPGHWYRAGMKLLLLLLPQVYQCASLDAGTVLG